MSVKQDMVGVRTAQDLERKYNLAFEKQNKKTNGQLVKFQNELEQFINSTLDSLEDIKEGAVTTWYYSGTPNDSNEPTKNWISDEEKNLHIGDLYYDKDTGYGYIYENVDDTYTWALIENKKIQDALATASAAKDTADNKRRVFLDTPNPPYENGDLWINNKEIYVCQISKDESESYSDDDFIVATKYTDDTLAKSIGDELTIVKGTVTKISESNDKIRTEVEETVKLVNKSVEVFKTNIETNNVIISVDSTNHPLETANYDISHNSTYLEENIQVTPTKAENHTGIVVAINENTIRFGVNKDIPIPNLDNKYTFTFKHTDENDKEYITKKIIVLSLIPKGMDGQNGQDGEKGDTGPQGEKGDAGPQGEQGLQGEKGDKGDEGSPGQAGKDAAIQSDTAPSDTLQMWYDTNTNELKRHNGSEWIVVNDYSSEINSVSDLVERLEGLTKEELDFLSGQVEQLKTTVSTSFEQTKNAFEMQFKTVQQQITNNQNSVDAQINGILSYIRFEDGNILLGEVSNPYTLKIEKDRLTITYQDKDISKWIRDVAYFSEIHIGNFAFIPRDNGSLSLVKVGV